MTMQMEIKKAIAQCAVTRKQAEYLVAHKRMTIVDSFVGTIEGGHFTKPTYVIRRGA